MTARYHEYFDDTGGMQEKIPFRARSRRKDKIAIIDVKGVIGAGNAVRQEAN